MSFWLPDRFFSRLTSINIKSDVIDLGIKNILLDIDNTIMPRDTKIIPEDIKKWLKQSSDLGIKFCLISNDWHKHVLKASEELGIPIVVKSLKPLPFAFMRALKKINANRKESLMIGDQLMTDVFGAHFLGIRCYLLLPLVKQDLKHTLLLRKIEKLFLRGRMPETAPIGG